MAAPTGYFLDRRHGGEFFIAGVGAAMAATEAIVIVLP